MAAGLAGLGGARVAQARSDLRRAAFVLGVADYAHAPPLETPVRDATRIAGLLRASGYRTVLRHNLGRDALLQELLRFRNLAQQADVIVLYVAGHGVFQGGESYFLPQDGADRGAALWDHALPVRGLLASLSDRIRHKVLFADCCRTLATLPPPPSAPTQAPIAAGVHATFAAQPGQAALDDVGGQSPFAAALSKVLAQPGLSVDEAAQHVRLTTMRLSQGQQMPWTISTLLSPLTLTPAAPSARSH